jgi:hypothetical protein
MPRYFFHLRFGRRRFLPDEEGIELRNRTAARDEALAVVRELATPEIENARRRWASWFLEVADEQGGFFRTPIGHPALEVVTPDAQDPRADQPELKPVRPAATAARDGAVARVRPAEIIRQMAAHRQITEQLLQASPRLCRELSSICLTSQSICVRTGRLVSLARLEGGRNAANSTVNPRADVAPSSPTTASSPAARTRPRRRTTEQRDELAPPHSITSSAAACSVRGTVSPSACAVVRLITNSKWVGCRTGSSAGLAPLRICATYSPAWRYIQLMLGP